MPETLFATAFAAIAEAYKKENTTEKKVLYDTYRTESIRSYADRMVLSAAGGEESLPAAWTF